MAFSREQLGEMVDTLESTAWTRVGVLPQDPHLETDSQFGVTKALIGNYVKKGDGYELAFEFQLEPGEARLPKAPITQKVDASAAARA